MWGQVRILIKQRGGLKIRELLLRRESTKLLSAPLTLSGQTQGRGEQQSDDL